MIPTSMEPLVQSFNEAETAQFFENLWRLLAERVQRYTMGDSTSVPVETARELLLSICFTLRYALKISRLSARDLLEKDLNTVLKSGQTHLLEKVQEVEKQWDCVYELAELSENPEVMESLALIQCYLKRYDIYYFAHQTPWDMGLPLFGPIPEKFKGITYVEAYLNELRKLLSNRSI